MNQAQNLIEISMRFPVLQKKQIHIPLAVCECGPISPGGCILQVFARRKRDTPGQDCCPLLTEPWCQSFVTPLLLQLRRDSALKPEKKGFPPIIDVVGPNSDIRSNATGFSTNANVIFRIVYCNCELILVAQKVVLPAPFFSAAHQPKN